MGCAKSLFLSGNSRMHFLSTETKLLPLGEVSAIISFFANEFNQSKSFFAIPRPARACLLLTSREPSSLEATPDEREGQLFWLCGEATLLGAPGLAEFSPLGSHQEFQLNEICLSLRRVVCCVDLNRLGLLEFPTCESR